MPAITLTIHERTATLALDVPGAKVNAFSAAVMAELEAHLATLEHGIAADVLVIRSAKPGVFIAGADIQEIATIHDQADALAKAHAGQRLFDRIQRLAMPSIAVIEGVCLGGGLECALACTWRIASDDPKVKLGLPEVSLGIIPGWGGTQRLPRLCGWRCACEVILAGRQLPAGKALAAGLVDHVLPAGMIDAALPGICDEVRAGGAKLRANRYRHGLLDSAIGRRVVLRGARQEVLRKTKGLMPAPLAALEVLGRTGGTALADGLAIEAEVFSRLPTTPESRALVDLYYANEAAKKSSPGGAKAQAIGVLGAGIMGGGIAWAGAAAGLSVRCRDLAWPAVAKAHKTAADYDRQLAKLRKLKPNEQRLRALRIAGQLDWTGFDHLDAVIEAVVEDLGVKRKVLAEAERHMRADAVLASNTSSLSIAAMAEALQRPELFAGMHFFNPVNRMPLVEVVAGPKTAPETLARIAGLARQMGKTVVVVRDCPGFLVNRILLPYMNEAARCLEDGGDAAAIDALIAGFGMPMGPFALADEVGLDVGTKVARILHQGYGERMAVAPVLETVYADLHLTGTKGGKGFFIHDGGDLRPNPEVVQAVHALQQQTRHLSRSVDEDEVLDRCMLTMVNEAARCVEEGIVDQPGQLDLAMIMGTGFPPSVGGPLHYADRLGAATVVERLQRLADAHGERFRPAKLLVDHAHRRTAFFPHA